MDLLTAIAACSLHFDEGLVKAIAIVQSDGNPYAVTDAAQPPTDEDVAATPATPPRSIQEALTHVERILARGGVPLVGLMPIPESWAAFYGRSRADLFDPCINISVGTAVLSNFEDECAPKPAKPGGRAKAVDRFALRGCILRKYSESMGVPQFTELVEHALQTSPTPLPNAHPSFQAPVVTTSNAPRAWGTDRVLFTLPKSPAPAERRPPVAKATTPATPLTPPPANPATR